MVLSIEIAPQTEARLREQALAAGKDVASYITELVEQAAVRQSLDETLAPIRRQFRASGISEGQLINDITQSQAEYRAEKKKSP